MANPNVHNPKIFEPGPGVPSTHQNEFGLRDLFAICAPSPQDYPYQHGTGETEIERRWRYADQMLEARDGHPN